MNSHVAGQARQKIINGSEKARCVLCKTWATGMLGLWCLRLARGSKEIMSGRHGWPASAVFYALLGVVMVLGRASLFGGLGIGQILLGMIVFSLVIDIEQWHQWEMDWMREMAGQVAPGRVGSILQMGDKIGDGFLAEIVGRLPKGVLSRTEKGIQAGVLVHPSVAVREAGKKNVSVQKVGKNE